MMKRRGMSSSARAAACALACLALLGPSWGGTVEPPDEPPTRERGEEALRLGFVTDAQEMGERPQLKRALAELDEWDAEWLLYGGDTNYDYQDAPRDWKEAMEPFEDRTLFVYGNHDGGPRYADYHPGESEPPWWAWREGNVTIIGLHTSRDIWNGSYQSQWLEDELAKETDNRTIILMMHIAWWVPNAHHGPETAFLGDAEEMDAIVQRHDIDLVLAGHEHYYSRMVRDGTTHVVNGAVEAKTRSVPEQVTEASEKASRDQTWMRLEVLSCGIAGWTHDVTTGQLIDAFETTQSVRIEGEGASCAPPPVLQTAPSEPGPTSDDSPPRSPPSRALVRAPLLLGAVPFEARAPTASPVPHVHHDSPPPASAPDAAPPLGTEGALVLVVPKAAAWTVGVPAALAVGFVLGRASRRDVHQGGGGGSRRFADALAWTLARLRGLRHTVVAGIRPPPPGRP